MRQGRRVVLSVLVSALVAVTQPTQPAQAAPDEDTVKQIVDGYMKPFLAKRNIPGAIVGVSIKGHEYFFPYGKATDSGDPFRPDTLVEIGSCTKTFTTTLFALAVNRNQMKASVPAQQYMPGGFKLQPGAQRMTPLELADFTSGLPDDPTDLPSGPLWKRNIEHYTTTNFLTWVSSWTPETPLPAPYKYSNAGIGLLGYLVSQATGQLWEQQINAEITTPLSMSDTLLRPSPGQMKRMAEGHTKSGQKAPPWPIYAWYAAGGLRSTAQDMLHFGEANLGHTEVDGHPVSAELIAAMKLAQTPIYTMPNGKNQQAMAWVNNEGSGAPGIHTVIVKNGGTAGFSSVIVLNPFKDLTLFIVTNRNGDNPTDIGIKVARHLP